MPKMKSIALPAEKFFGTKLGNYSTLSIQFYYLEYLIFRILIISFYYVKVHIVYNYFA